MGDGNKVKSKLTRKMAQIFANCHGYILTFACDGHDKMAIKKGQW